MENDTRLKQALDWRYSVAVRASGKGYELLIRELGLRHTCRDLAAGFAEMEAKKEAWLRDLADEGLWDWMTPPGGPEAPENPVRARWRGLIPFFVKFACVAVLLLFVVGRLESALGNIGYTLEKKIDSVLVMTPEKMEANREKARVMAQKLRPIVQEIMGMFREEPQATTQASEPSPDQAEAGRQEIAPSVPLSAPAGNPPAQQPARKAGDKG